MVEDLLADLIEVDLYDSVNENYKGISDFEELKAILDLIDSNISRMTEKFNVSNIDKIAHITFSFRSKNSEIHFLLVSRFDQNFQKQREKMDEWQKFTSAFLGKNFVGNFGNSETAKAPCYIKFIQEHLPTAKTTFILYTNPSPECYKHTLPILTEIQKFQKSLTNFQKKNTTAKKSQNMNSAKHQLTQSRLSRTGEVGDFATQLVSEINLFLKDSEKYLETNSDCRILERKRREFEYKANLAEKGAENSIIRKRLLRSQRRLKDLKERMSRVSFKAAKEYESERRKSANRGNSRLEAAKKPPSPYLKGRPTSRRKSRDERREEFSEGKKSVGRYKYQRKSSGGSVASVKRKSGLKKFMKVSQAHPEFGKFSDSSSSTDSDSSADLNFKKPNLRKFSKNLTQKIKSTLYNNEEENFKNSKRFKKEKKKFKKVLKKLSKELKTKLQENEELRKTEFKQEMIINDLESKLDNLQDEQEAYEKSTETLKRELEELSDLLSSERQTKLEKKQKWSQQKETFRTQIENLNLENSKLTNLVEKLQNSLENQKLNCEENDEKSKILSTELERLKSELDEVQVQAMSLQGENNQKENKIMELSMKLEIEGEKLETWKLRLEEEEMEKEELKQELEKQREELASFKRRKLEVENSEIIGLREENNEFRKLLEEREKEREELSGMMEELRSDMERMEAKLREGEEVKQELRNEQEKAANFVRKIGDVDRLNKINEERITVKNQNLKNYLIDIRARKLNFEEPSPFLRNRNRRVQGPVPHPQTTLNRGNTSKP